MREDSHPAARLQVLDALAAQIASYLHATLDDLSNVRVAMVELLDCVEEEQRQPTRSDLGAIREILQTYLKRPHHPMDRIGVATAFRYLADSPYWMEWWGSDARGSVVFVSHSLNPQKDTFYDYTARSWFSVPKTSGTTAIIGPYVDFGGINSYTYTVTISVPVITSHGFAAVAGADILAGQFERFLLRTGQDPQRVLLVNADLRVIASTTSAHLPGDLLRPSELASWKRLEVASDLFPWGKSWQLLSPA